MFDLAGKSHDETFAALGRSDVTFVCGGNTFHLLHHMKESGFFDEIGRRVSEGLVYVGSSAGSVAATPDISYASSVDDPSKGGHHGNAGLGFIDRPVLPHMDHPAFSQYVRALADGFEADGAAYYGLNDDEAVLVDEDGPRVVKSADYVNDMRIADTPSL
jgi:dipeptidase E